MESPGAGAAGPFLVSAFSISVFPFAPSTLNLQRRRRLPLHASVYATSTGPSLPLCQNRPYSPPAHKSGPWRSSPIFVGRFGQSGYAPNTWHSETAVQPVKIGLRKHEGPVTMSWRNCRALERQLGHDLHIGREERFTSSQAGTPVEIHRLRGECPGACGQIGERRERTQPRRRVQGDVEVC